MEEEREEGVFERLIAEHSEHGEPAIAASTPQSMKAKVSQEQIQGLLFGEQLSWQAIIYDLINTDQLDPWDIDIVLLSNRFLERVKELEEANFFVSSKVLLAAALLLRIKSEILLHHFIPSLDDILFGKKVEKKYVQERIELDEEIPNLVPRTPLPRFRRVTLEELMAALGKAITTENRRIRKVVTLRQQEMETALSLPKGGKINLKDQIRDVYTTIRDKSNKGETKIPFSDISGESREQKLATFVPLLHLDTQHKVLLEQHVHFEEIWVWLKHIYEKAHAEELAVLRKEVEEALSTEGALTDEEKKRAEKIEEEYANPLDEEEEEEKVDGRKGFTSDVEDIDED